MFTKTKPVMTILVIFLFMGLFAPRALAQDENIVVKGYGYNRSTYALVNASGQVPSNPFFHADLLVNSLKQKFGSGKYVSCPVDLQGTVDSVATGSLVNSDGQLLADIFWLPALRNSIAEAEAIEIANFVKEGGILYVGGSSTSSYNLGSELDILFQKLGIGDRFSSEFYSPSVSLLSNEPSESIVTRGVFGNIGPIFHDFYRIFSSERLRQIISSSREEYIIHESKIGDGYVVVSGGLLYSNYHLQDTNTLNYFLNLFALGCGERDFGKYEKVALEVPTYKQGLFEYDGLDPIWENAVYDHGDQQALWCGQTMAECACALTSATMVMRYNGVDRLWYNEDIDPASVNGYFNQFTKLTDSHYESYGFSNGNVLWSAVSGLTADSNVVHSTPKLEQPHREDYDVEKIKQYIDNGIPVIQQVSGNFGTHWVVVKGYEPSTNRLIINDPAYPDPTPGSYAYLDELYTPKSSRSMITYVKTNSDFRYLEFTSSSPQHILVTDQAGNKTGFDPELGVIVEQIPNSQYIFEAAYGDATGRRASPPADAGVNVLTIQLPSDGDYKLETTAGLVPQSVSIHSSDRAGKRVFDSIIPRDGAAYNVLYDELSAGQEVNISEIIEEIEIQIDIEPFVKNNVIIPAKWLPVPVAILASGQFDVAKINKASMTFGKTGEEPSLISCANKLVDVNRDKLKDLVCYFLGSKTQLDIADTQATLKGRYEGNINFIGQDKVKVLKPWFLF